MAMVTGPFAGLLSGMARYGRLIVEVWDADGELAFSSDREATEAPPPEERRAFSGRVIGTGAFHRAAGNGSGEIFGVPLRRGEEVVGALTACDTRDWRDLLAASGSMNTSSHTEEMKTLLTSLATLMQETWGNQDDLDEITES